MELKAFSYHEKQRGTYHWSGRKYIGSIWNAESCMKSAVVEQLPLDKTVASLLECIK